MSRKFLVFLMIMLLGFKSNLQAQKYQTVLLNNPLSIKFPTEIDSLQIDYHLNFFKNKYISKGYINFNVDSIKWANRKVFIYNYIGEVYRLNQIILDSSSIMFNGIGNRYLKQTYDTMGASKIAQSILS